MVLLLDFSGAILDDDTVKCWPGDGSGVTGISPGDEEYDVRMGDSRPPVSMFVDSAMSGRLLKAKAIAIRDIDTCAILLDDDSIYCWTINAWHWNASKSSSPQLEPRTINMGTGLKAKAVAMGGNSQGTLFSCAILGDSYDSSVKCWGYTRYGPDDELTGNVLGLGGVVNVGPVFIDGIDYGGMGDALPFVNLVGSVATR